MIARTHSRVRLAMAAGLLAAAVAPSSLAAQGTLSGLGFGYPVGGISTRTAGTGGALGEFDPISPRNPAALGGLDRIFLVAQAEPEFRTLRQGGVTERTTAQRVPLIMVGFPAPRGFGVALSATSFLDRSFTTLTKGNVVLNGQTFVTDDRTDVRGSIGDLRAAIGWRPGTRFSLGFAGHLFTGDNVIADSRTFPDTTAFGSVLDSTRVTFFGTALSIGGEVQLLPGLSAAASYRVGGSLESRIRDSVRTRANVPNRLGVGVRYDGIAGSTFVGGIEQQDWSRMQALGSAAVQAHDATNWHVGAEVAGPRMRGAGVQLRVGYAASTLPFGIDGRTVRETRFTGGIGLPVALREAVSIDLSVQRANRALGGGGAKESAWLLGAGIQIRP